MITLADQLKTLAKQLASSADADVRDLAPTATRIAETLDARASILIVASPDESEAVALSLGDPERAGGLDHDITCTRFGCQKGNDSACPFVVCECWTYPAEHRQTGHHPNCQFWHAHAGVRE